MALNPRQERFIEEIQAVSDTECDSYSKAYRLNKSFAEEFKGRQDNDRSLKATELSEKGLSYADIQTLIEQAFDRIRKVHDGEEITTREIGKDLRRIARI